MDPSSPDEVADAARADRRGFLRLAGVGLVGAAAALGTAGGAGATAYRDTQAARRRNNGATVATLSTATSLQVLWRARTERKVLALTFDDGPGEELTPGLLDVLAETGTRATFALVGEKATRYPDLVRRQHAAGHELANHSWTHADLGLLDYDGIRRELVRTDDLLEHLTGLRTRVIRPPFGRVHGALLQYAAQVGQQLLMWDMRLLEDDYDSVGNADYVLEHLRPGSVLLAHDAGLAKRKIGIAAIPAIIRGAREQGYEFVTASEMFAIDSTACA
ncbi:MAG: polysaccharide deacetylase family protein [Sporichthyaceae bacterium]